MTTQTTALRERMIEDMKARNLNRHTQRSHIASCKRFAAHLKHSPDIATPDDVRRFQLCLIESGASICNRNRIMSGVKFLFRVTLRRHDLAAEIYHIKVTANDPGCFKTRMLIRFLGGFAGAQHEAVHRRSGAGSSDLVPRMPGRLGR